MLRHDGVAALDDQTRFNIASPSGRQVTHLVAACDERPAVGYAQVTTDTAAATAHLMVDPAYRRVGVATALAQGLTEVAGHNELRVWAHGDLSPAQHLADRLGFSRSRELLQLQQTPGGGGPSQAGPGYPDGVTVRPFEVGRDEDAWLALNASAFTHHPEQAGMTRADLDQRIDQNWFDPAGFFLAERDRRLIGFHWTKVHAEQHDPSDGDASAGDGHTEKIGEVYVLGVHPDAQGIGLGTTLTKTGLRYLYGVRKVDRIILYVEGDNAPALAVYRRLGFSTARVDVVYTRASR